MNTLRHLMKRFGSSAMDSETSVIEVDKLTHSPQKAWDKIKVKQPKGCPPQTLPLNEPVHPNKVRFVCMSDTHHQTSRIGDGFIPGGDVFIHAGDFSNVGQPSDIEGFNDFLGTYKHSTLLAPLILRMDLCLAVTLQVRNCLMIRIFVDYQLS